MARLAIERFTELGDDLAPDFSLSIEGIGAAKSRSLFEAIRPLVASCSIEFDEEMSTLFELVVINQPEEAVANVGGFGAPVNWQVVLNSKAFQEGNSVDLFMGYAGVKRFMGRTEIVKWLPDFGPDGPTSFVIKGFDGRHEMATGNQFRVGKKIGSSVSAPPTTPRSRRRSRRKRKRRTFYREQDHDIVRRIAEKYGYGADVDVTDRRAVATRSHETSVSDWQFISKLAEINRFDLWVDWDIDKRQYVVYFKRRKDIGSPEFEFFYNGKDGSLISATPDFQVKDQVTDVEVLVYDKKRRAIERTVISDAVTEEQLKLASAGVGAFEAGKQISVGARVRFSAFGQVFEAFSAKPFKSKGEAQRFVENYLRENERELLILQGRVIGIETLRPRQVHLLRGLSARIDGLYRFTNVKHIMAPGQPYVCEFVAHKVLRTDIARRSVTTETPEVSTGTQAAG